MLGCRGVKLVDISVLGAAQRVEGAGKAEILGILRPAVRRVENQRHGRRRRVAAPRTPGISKLIRLAHVLLTPAFGGPPFFSQQPRPTALGPAALGTPNLRVARRRSKAWRRRGTTATPAREVVRAISSSGELHRSGPPNRPRCRSATTSAPMPERLPAISLVAVPGRRRQTSTSPARSRARLFRHYMPAAGATWRNASGSPSPPKCKIRFRDRDRPDLCPDARGFAMSAAYIHGVSSGRFRFGIGSRMADHQRLGVAAESRSPTRAPLSRS